jgi:hypothetical protein
MAHRRNLTVAPTPSPTAGTAGGSRPKPPKAGARSARLDANVGPADHHGALPRLTFDTVAQSTRAPEALMIGASAASFAAR